MEIRHKAGDIHKADQKTARLLQSQAPLTSAPPLRRAGGQGGRGCQQTTLLDRRSTSKCVAIGNRNRGPGQSPEGAAQAREKGETISRLSAIERTATRMFAAIPWQEHEQKSGPAPFSLPVHGGGRFPTNCQVVSDSGTVPVASLTYSRLPAFLTPGASVQKRAFREQAELPTGCSLLGGLTC